MNAYAQVDSLLAVAQDIVNDILEANDDSRYGLIKSALDHIIAARSDLDADLK